MSAELNSSATGNPVLDHLGMWSSATVKKAAAGRGGNGNISPYGIQKLRELILELAVRGKLVPQDPNDEPAKVLLKRIAAEKERLLKEGLIKKQRPVPEIVEGDIRFAPPVGWTWGKLGSLAIQITDGVHHTPEYLDQGVPFISVKDIDGRTVSFDDCKYISEEQHEEINKRCNPEYGDILLCRIGTLGRATIVDTKEPFSLFVSVGLLKFAQEMLIPRFMHLVFHSPLLVKQYEEIKAGGSHTNKLNLTDLPKLIVPIAPTAEQHRIVAKVDKLMALCDQLEQQLTNSLQAHQTLVETLLRTLVDDVQDAQVSRKAGKPGATAGDAESTQQAWNRIAEHFDTLFTTEESIDQLKQTILQLAVMGRLVRQDPNDEPVSMLLDQIDSRRKELVQEDQLRPQRPIPGVREEDEPWRLPRGWQFVRFGMVTFNRDAERIPLSVADRRGRQGKYDYYGASGVIDSIDGYLFDKPLLLIGEDGANLINRSTPIAFMARGKYWVNNHAHVLDGLTEDLLLYVALHINAISLESYVTGTAQPKMNQAKMNTIVLALPPLEEQKRIIAKVEELMALCDTLKARIRDAQDTQIDLADAVVEHAVA